MPDLQAAIFEYGSVPAYVRLTLGTETAEMTRLMGPKGMLEIRERDFTYTPQRGIDTAPSYYAQGFPTAMRAAYDNRLAQGARSRARPRIRRRSRHLQRPFV